MIADLDETIRQLLKRELPIRNNEIEVSFDQPRREWSARLTRPSVNLYLYDLRENNTLRQHQWERLPASNTIGDRVAHLKRSPMRVDCTYMLTAWANDPEDEHRLLTRCLLALFRFPILPGDRLVGTLQNPTFDIQARLAAHDKLTNPAEVWSALDNEMRPSVSYIVTLALDPWQMQIREEPIVRTFTLRSGQSQALPYQPLLLGGTRDELTLIGGVLRDKGRDGDAVAGAQVAIKGTGLVASTDEQGRFQLGRLPGGEYTLVAWPTEGKPKEKRITVPVIGEDGRPARDGDYDLEI
jgi:hypothetical protein